MMTVGNKLQPRPFVRQPGTDHTRRSVMQPRHTVKAVHQPVCTDVKGGEGLLVRGATVAQHHTDTPLLQVANGL